MSRRCPQLRLIGGHTFYEEGVVTALAQFHHDIEEGGDGRGGSCTALREKHEVPLKNGSIILLLDSCQLNLHTHIMYMHMYTAIKLSEKTTL